MSSASRSAVVSAAGVALLGGAAFVSTTAPTSRTGHLRATASSATATSPQASAPEANVACLAVAGVAATCFASRKASSNSRHQLVALTAFENELGVQAPVGFWDPAGFTADGSTDNFARRRQTELKHGRI
eukprot:CAMPEP_0181426476 /NCGR_PEP_ID=MMETSP1110-20121109/15682_1 /TAXON_ID=174948 /ORGANISM="Symbiodinium sp., Strain CCMP421" /LENGTH=129 /DNA_ID=CAMNT_0023549671 /DNA_START=86 /DNA_END=472 /DNA_ORIENTATION=+